MSFVLVLALLSISACDSEQLMSDLEPIRTDTVLVLRNPPQIVHDPPYVAESLELAAGNQVFSEHVERAYERWRQLNGTNQEPLTLFDKVVAATDYVANLAKHPHRHEMGLPASDPRAESMLGFPEGLAILAVENQMWTGTDWVPQSGKSLVDIPPLECTYQHLILGGLVNVIGAQWRLIVTEAHTPFAYYDFEFGKWVYIESTFNEHYRLRSAPADDYVPLSPRELRLLSIENRTDEIVAIRHSYQPQRFGPESPYYVRPYVAGAPRGWAPMTVSQLGLSVSNRSVGYDLRVLPGHDSESYFEDFIDQGWPLDDDPGSIWERQGEAFLLNLVRVSDTRFAVQLTTNLAVDAPEFERNIRGRRGWARRLAADTLVIGPGMEIRIRARSGSFVSGEVILKGM